MGRTSNNKHIYVCVTPAPSGRQTYRHLLMHTHRNDNGDLIYLQIRDKGLDNDSSVSAPPRLWLNDPICVDDPSHRTNSRHAAYAYPREATIHSVSQAIIGEGQHGVGLYTSVADSVERRSL